MSTPLSSPAPLREGQTVVPHATPSPNHSGAGPATPGNASPPPFERSRLQGQTAARAMEAPERVAEAPARPGPRTGRSGGPTRLRSDDGRLQRGRRSRARIRAAARSLFRERGFDGATLRAIGARAEMGASSIYRHFQSKEELLVDELAELQEEAWSRFRAEDDRARPTAERIRAFFDAQHAMLVADRDLTTIALRATTKTEARVARRVLQLHDRTIGLLMEILQHGRMKKQLGREVDVLETARVLFHVSNGARIPWANGMVSDEALQRSMHQAVELLFAGVGGDLD
jgi:AcrR family transcriptional regulator